MAELSGPEVCCTPLAELTLQQVLAVAVVRSRQRVAVEAARWKERAGQLEAALASAAQERGLLQRSAQQQPGSSQDEHTSCLLCESTHPALSPVWRGIAAECDGLLAEGYSAAAVAAVRDARLAECPWSGRSDALSQLHASEYSAAGPWSTPLAAVVSFTLCTVRRLPQGATQAAPLAAATEFLLQALQPGVQAQAEAGAALRMLVPGLLAAACPPPGASEAGAHMEASTSASQASCSSTPRDAALHPAANVLECLLQVPGVGLAALRAAAAHMRGAARALSEGAAAGLDDAAFFISLLHACLAHLPSWLQGAADDTEAAAKEALSQATSDILAAYKLAEVHAAAAPDFAAAVRAAAAELITALEVVSGQGLSMG